MIDNVSDRGRRNPFSSVNTSVDPQCRGIWFSVAYSYNLSRGLFFPFYRIARIILLCIVRKNTYLERPPFDRVTDGDDRTNVGESVSQVVEVSVNVLESVVTGPFHSMTWRVYLQDYSEVARSVSLDETWKYSAPWIQRRGLIDIRLIFFSINSMFKRKIELFWIDEAGYARKSLTPKLPRATDTVHASYRITKRTWIFTWPDRDSLPPSVTS